MICLQALGNITCYAHRCCISERLCHAATEHVFVCVGPTVDGSRPCLAAFHTKNEQAHLWILIYVCMHIPQTSAAISGLLVAVWVPARQILHRNTTTNNIARRRQRLAPTPPHTHRNKTHLLSYCFWLASYSGHLFPCPLDELWVTKLWCFHDHVQLYINIEMLAQDRMTFCRLRLLRRREDDLAPPEEDDLSPTEEDDLSPPVSSDCYRASRRERGQRARNGFRSSR